MKVIIDKSRLSGRMSAPPSKSMAHRYLICAALSRGVCTVSNIDMSDDVRATLDCLGALGVGVKAGDGCVTVDGSGLFSKADVLDCNESGSTLRFMIPICLLADKTLTLKGTKRLFSRSLDIYKELCDSRGFEFLQKEDSVTVKGRLYPDRYVVKGNVSSQFISGLLYVLPLLSGDSVIEITGELQSAPYIDMTITAQKCYGVDISRDGNIINIKGNQKYTPTDTVVEGDCSNAAFFEALNVIGQSVKVTGLDPDTLQGDYIFYEYFEKLKNGRPTLDIKNCPDLAPILMAVAAAKGGARLTNTARLKIKESDRGNAMKQELEKLGVVVKVRDNDIEIGCGISPPTSVIYGHNDHRIVMACAVLLTLTGGSIDGAEAVCKSLPDFFERMRALGAKVRYEAK